MRSVALWLKQPLLEDKTVMKKHTREGPNDTAKVKLVVVGDTVGAASLDGFTPNVSKFTAGNGEVSNTLEYATVTEPALAQEAQLLGGHSDRHGAPLLDGNFWTRRSARAGRGRTSGRGPVARSFDERGAADPAARGGIQVSGDAAGFARTGSAAEAVGYPESAQGMQPGWHCA